MNTITFEQAKELKHGTILYHVTDRNADDTPMRWRVNGQVRLWKTRPKDIEVPLKYGMKGYSYLNHTNLREFCLAERNAYIAGLRRKVNINSFGNHNRNVDLLIDNRLVPASDHDWGNFEEQIKEWKGTKLSQWECDLLLDIYKTVSGS